MAQADPEGTEGAPAAEEGWLGLSTWAWVGIGVGVAAVAGIAIAAGGGGGGDHEAPACP